MVDNVLGTAAYYFSTSYDLTHSLQRLHNTSPEFLQIPLNERVSEKHKSENRYENNQNNLKIDLRVCVCMFID